MTLSHVVGVAKLALGLMLAALTTAFAGCGGGGDSTTSSPSSATAGSPTASAPSSAPGQAARSLSGDDLQAARGRAKKSRSRPDPACRKPSYCTPANREAGTFWPTRRHPDPQRNGSVTYANSPADFPPRPGEVALASPAFAVSELLPKAYSCDGAGVSPPLRWRNVPPDAASLVLYVIDVSQGWARRGGIRWVVANIDPHSEGVAAGEVPEGGIVGTNTEGKAAYSPACPPHGEVSWLAFQLYAVSKQLSLSTGFQPSVAQSEYGGHLLNDAATTHAVYIKG